MEKPDLYVLARLLEALWSPDVELTRRQLQMRAGLNYTLFVRYLDFIVSRGLACVSPNKAGVDVVRITPAGLSVHRELTVWIARLLGDGM